MAAAALVLLLAACDSGSDDPTPEEPTSASPTTSTPTATLPTMPAQASEDSSEGAAAFVKHYVDVFNYAAATGDVDELSRLSSPDCEGCQRYIKLYRDTYAAGGYFRGGDWKIGDLEVERSTESHRLFGHLTSAPGTQAVSRGARSGPTEPEDADLIFVITRSDDRKLMKSLTRSEP
jgi:hypothetical protein